MSTTIFVAFAHIPKCCSVSLSTIFAGGDQVGEGKHGHHLGLRVGEVRLRGEALLLDQSDVIDAAGHFFTAQSADVDALVVILKHDLPLAVAILAHSDVSGSSPICVHGSLVSFSAALLHIGALLVGQK